MQQLIAFDHHLFYLLNSLYTCAVFDWLMPVITSVKYWLPLIAIVWLGLLCSGCRQWRVLALILLLSVSFTDLICARVIKKTVKRARPCTLAQDGDLQCRLLLPMKSSFSFPSNHAANTAALAGSVFLFCGWQVGLPFFLLSLLIGYSRIYVGVHFPLDVLAGWCTGLLLAWFVFTAMRRYQETPPEPPVPT